MNVALNRPDMVVDGEKQIMIYRDNQQMTVHYLDLQIGDLYFFQEDDGIPRQYRVIDIGGTPSGNAEITTEVIQAFRKEEQAAPLQLSPMYLGGSPGFSSTNAVSIISTIGSP